MKYFNFLLSFFLIGSLVSCVSSKKYKALQASTVDAELRLQKAGELIKELKADTAFLGNALRGQQAKLAEQSQYADYTKAALVRKLKKQEKVLAERDFALIGKSRYLEDQSKKLETTEKDLKDRDRRISTIRSQLFSHKVILDSMLNQLSSLLIGYDSENLNIYKRDGSLHITLSEAVLFAVGSVNLNESSAAILPPIAAVLSRYHDIEIGVVGHTDDKPIQMGVIKDNWDYGAVRAGAVTRALTKHGVSAWILTPISKNEYYPIADNTDTEGRKRNRRIDIVVSPVWEKFYKMVDFQIF